MNTIKPKMVNVTERRTIQKSRNQNINHPPSNAVSFKAGVNPQKVIDLMSDADKQVLKLFSKHYKDVADRLITKSDTLITQGNTLIKRSARFAQDDAKNLIVKDKSIPKSLLENVLFPFITLPLYAASWVVNKAKSIPVLSKKAGEWYKNTILRTPRKINELNEKSNQIKGVFEKTRKTVADFIQEKGIYGKLEPEELAKKTDELIQRMNNGENTSLIQEAHEYVQENLYKASNKFFDKHTGNFNTAYERPLNRIVTGLIPVAFLANDAYNLSVICGDKKEDSKKEATERTKQEVSRVFTTAFIQLITFGAFTKLVNTKSWFTPLTSALTVLVSETTSRARLGKPVFFLSKEKAKKYNQKEAEKTTNATTQEQKVAATAVKQSDTVQQSKTNYSNMLTPDLSQSKVFSSFKGNEPAKNADKPKEQKALMNFETFKKGVAMLVAGGFALSFLKNSSLTKNSQIMKALRNFGETIKKKLYDPLAFKEFQISESDFSGLMKILDEVGCDDVANGHRFINNKYGVIQDGVIRMKKGVISVSDAITEIKSKLTGIATDDMEKIEAAIKTAVKTEGDKISEMKYESVAKKAMQIIKNKKVNIPNEQMEGLTEIIKDAIKASEADAKYIKMDSKLKPFVDIVIEPFKFIWAAANLPFKKIVTPAVNLATGKIQEKAADAALGKAELTRIEKTINKVVTEIWGEQKAKSGKISQTVFANAMEQLQKATTPYTKAKENLAKLVEAKAPTEAIKKAELKLEFETEKLKKYVNNAVAKSFDGVTQSSNKNTDVAMMTKLASSTVTSAFLVADNYNMVMMKSNGEDTEGAKEKANERIIQRLSALFYQTMLINWFNSTFKSTYNSSLKGMVAVAIPNTLTTEILTRKSIGMPIRRKTYEQLLENEEKNENRTGFAGKYFKFMRLLTGKKPLKDRMPKNKQNTSTINKPTVAITNSNTTNLLERYSK